MFREFVTQTATPLKNVMVDKVTTNGGILKVVMESPLIQPINAHTRRIAKKPNGTDQGLPANHPPFAVMISPPATLLHARTEVTERSIPAVIRTKPWAIETTNKGS